MSASDSGYSSGAVAGPSAMMAAEIETATATLPLSSQGHSSTLLGCCFAKQVHHSVHLFFVQPAKGTSRCHIELAPSRTPRASSRWRSAARGCARRCSGGGGRSSTAAAAVTAAASCSPPPSPSSSSRRRHPPPPPFSSQQRARSSSFSKWHSSFRWAR